MITSDGHGSITIKEFLERLSNNLLVIGGCPKSWPTLLIKCSERNDLIEEIAIIITVRN
jgi:hypothetical protein